MESTLKSRRPQEYPSYAVGEVISAVVAAGWGRFARWLDAVARAQNRARARRELHYLSDRTLRDIGIERSDIDGLFRR